MISVLNFSMAVSYESPTAVPVENDSSLACAIRVSIGKERSESSVGSLFKAASASFVLKVVSKIVSFCSNDASSSERNCGKTALDLGSSPVAGTDAQIRSGDDGSAA